MSQAPKKSKVGCGAVGQLGEYEEALMKMVHCQIETDEVLLKELYEIMDTNGAFQEKSKPLYEKRAEIIKRIDKFWLKAITNHPKISTVLHKDEDDCLHFLTHLEVEDKLGNVLGYRIRFFFDENPYFENKMLTKDCTMGDLSKSTQIQWKEGKDLIKQVLAKPFPKKKKRFTACKSFFHWFLSDAEMCSDKIGMYIRNELWRNPLKYYSVPNVEAEDDENE